MKRFAVAAVLVSLAACAPAPDEAPGLDDPQEQWWAALQNLCGRAYAGEMVEGSPQDSIFVGRDLIMHVRQCSEREVRVPFHVGDDHSRTWVITRLEDGIRLKHDHRHEDGTEDEVTQYGGDTRGAGTAQRLEFHADEHTATLIPAAATNVWSIEIVPGSRFSYALRREGTDRRVRVDFDLTREVETPPTPWGY